MIVERRAWAASPRRPPRPCARWRPPASRSRAPSARSSPPCAPRGEQALQEYVERFDRVDPPAAGGAPRARRRARALDPAVRAGLEVAIANVRAVAEAGASPTTDVAPAPGPDRHAARGARAPRGDLRARRARAVPVDGGHGRRDGPGRRRRPRSSSARPGAAPGDPRRLRAVRRRRGLPDGRRARRRRAGLRHRDRAPRRRHRRARATLYVQEAKRQVSAAVGIDGFAGPSDVLIVVDDDADPSWSRSTSWPRPSTASAPSRRR